MCVCVCVSPFLYNAIRSHNKYIDNFIFFTISVIILCANPQTIREIMLAADDLNMVDSGEYVFFNIDLFNG